jgi:hypothetical protein
LTKAVEEGNNMPRTRTWSAESRNPGKSWGELTPIYTPQLTDDEIRQRRLELAQEMVELMLADGALASRPRQALVRIHTSLGIIRRQL